MPSQDPSAQGVMLHGGIRGQTTEDVDGLNAAGIRDSLTVVTDAGIGT
jgi:hypothetical protein